MAPYKGVLRHATLTIGVVQGVGAVQEPGVTLVQLVYTSNALPAGQELQLLGPEAELSEFGRQVSHSASQSSHDQNPSPRPVSVYSAYCPSGHYCSHMYDKLLMKYPSLQVRHPSIDGPSHVPQAQSQSLQ